MFNIFTSDNKLDSAILIRKRIHSLWLQQANGELNNGKAMLEKDYFNLSQREQKLRYRLMLEFKEQY